MKIKEKRYSKIMLHLWLYRIGLKETSFYFCEDGLRLDFDII